MSRQTIRKNSEDWELIPNLLDYHSAREHFSWAHERDELQGLPGGALNIAFEAVDRHAAGDRCDHVALRWLDNSGAATDFTYGELSRHSNRFANVLRSLGVAKGERVFALSERIPALYITALGTLKNGSVFCPLFSAFGPEPLQSRLTIGDARVLVTTEKLYRRKVAPLREALPQLQHVLLVRETPQGELPDGTLDFHQLLESAADQCTIEPTAPEDPALLHFTSGTTGTPKGALHVHEAVVAHYASARLALDLHPQDVFWCTADPGWVTGTSYGIIAPLTIGATMIVDSAEFEPQRWYGILRDHQVSVWYTAPTAVRMMMKYGAELAQQFTLPALRFMASVGEPLNPEAVYWGEEAFGLPFHDNWWQTETGGIMIANFLSQPIRPGSMGRPLPGIEAAVVRRRADGSVEVIEEADHEGELALKRGWPSMFRAYLHEEARYRQCFSGDWYLTGDLARRDADGYFWFVGRADDVIKSSGHLIGPFEVESALMEHPAVAEAAVIGVPDEVAGQAVKAFVSLKPGFSADETLQREILALARKRLGPAVAPRQLQIEDNLPRTRSGKIMRRLLKARELGLPEGDTSTLEGKS
ncbi:acetate--CoA ligase [Microbulbifer sp. SAOS-129_SWC]|uniref:acetate--CoA ligase n=1 Tax=Microbulbifer sp. SAOS-129_SWC TaxID=3145235 RepID=UPI00321796BD